MPDSPAIFTQILTLKGVPRLVADFFTALNMPKFAVALIFVLLSL